MKTYKLVKTEKLMEKKSFEIITDITLLWIANEKVINKLFANKDGLFEMIRDINKLYGTKIKTIVSIHKNIERLGYDTYYKEVD